MKELLFFRRNIDVFEVPLYQELQTSKKKKEA